MTTANENDHEEPEPIETDLKSVVAASKRLGPASTQQDVINFLRHELVPFIETHVAETLEQAVALDDIIREAEDILQPETARVFAAVIVGGMAMAAKVRELAAKDATGKLADQHLEMMVAEYEHTCKAGGDLLQEITLPDGQEGDEGEEEDEDDEGGDEDDEDEDEDDDDEEQG